jgi:hypothetical protein
MRGGLTSREICTTMNKTNRLRTSWLECVQADLLSWYLAFKGLTRHGREVLGQDTQSRGETERNQSRYVRQYHKPPLSLCATQ